MEMIVLNDFRLVGRLKHCEFVFAIYLWSIDEQPILLLKNCPVQCLRKIDKNLRKISIN